MVRVMLRLEGLALFVAAVILFRGFEGIWWVFPAALSRTRPHGGRLPCRTTRRQHRLQHFSQSCSCSDSTGRGLLPGLATRVVCRNDSAGTPGSRSRAGLWAEVFRRLQIYSHAASLISPQVGSRRPRAHRAITIATRGCPRMPPASPAKQHSFPKKRRAVSSKWTPISFSGHVLQ